MIVCFGVNIDAFGDDLPEIFAKGAVVINAQTGEILFDKNAHQRMEMASTTKIMSALIALSQDNLDEKFEVDSSAIQVEGSSMGLKEGDYVSLRDLCCGMLLPSGNDAANAAAVRISGSVEKFVELMNQTAQQMGLEDTHFVTPSGLDDDTTKHYSTALDMAKLGAEAIQDDDFYQICSQEQIKLNFGNPPFDRWLINSNKLLKYCEGVVGIKTGFTDKAGRCLVSACERDGATLVCVTLNDANDWEDHARLYDYCFDFLSLQKLDIPQDEYIVSCVGGDKNWIKCKTNEASAVLLNGKADLVEAKVYIYPFVYAPVNEGDKVGIVKYYYKDVLVAEEDIFSCEAAEYLVVLRRKAF